MNRLYFTFIRMKSLPTSMIIPTHPSKIIDFSHFHALSKIHPLHSRPVSGLVLGTATAVITQKVVDKLADKIAENAAEKTAEVAKSVVNSVSSTPLPPDTPKDTLSEDPGSDTSETESIKMVDKKDPFQKSQENGNYPASHPSEDPIIPGKKNTKVLIAPLGSRSSRSEALHWAQELNQHSSS